MLGVVLICLLGLAVTATVIGTYNYHRMQRKARAQHFANWLNA